MQPLASVLMSIYNETESQIRESVASVLSQDFKDFEFIIVLDKPERDDVETILESFNDSRIVFDKNSRNIGLAMSMNRAAGIASSEIFIRMDADDVCLPRRFSREIDIIKTGNYDFVFTNYDNIDDNSEIIKRAEIKQDMSDCIQLNKLVSLDPSIIHHPTVVFSRKIFEGVGGYRDFPCSQDSDLWMRMAEIGCRFYMIGQPFLQYRVNANSVSNKRWFKQQLTCNYIFELSIERLKKGKDTFSYSGYENYLDKWKVNDSASKDKLLDCYRLLSEASEFARKGQIIKSLILKAKVFMISPLMRRHFISLQTKKRLLRKVFIMKI